MLVELGSEGLVKSPLYVILFRLEMYLFDLDTNHLHMDKLFLLKPNFSDDKLETPDKLYYCPYCAAIEGVLYHYPFLREKLEITYVNFQRPRLPILELLGEDNQGCPVVVLDQSKHAKHEYPFIKEANGQLFISSWINIMNYLADNYKLSYPHP